MIERLTERMNIEFPRSKYVDMARKRAESLTPEQRRDRPQRRQAGKGIKKPRKLEQARLRALSLGVGKPKSDDERDE